jgi:hypothetical protein
MAREYAIVTSKFWTGETGRELRKDADAQRLALYLVTAPTSNMIGLYYLPLPTLCHEVGMTVKGASKALRRVSQLHFAHYDGASEWVWVPEMATYQIGTSLKPKDKRLAKVVSLLLEARKSPYAKDFVAKYGASYSLPSIDLSQAPSMPLRCQDQDQEQDKDQDQEQEHEVEAAPRTPARRTSKSAFEPPTAADVDAYCQSRSNGIAGQRFVDYYSARGWKLKGGSPMKDWQAAVRTWEQNNTRTEPLLDDPRGTVAAMNAYLNGSDG